MGWKENLEQKRQQREANRFFRQNNVEFFDASKWLKLVATGFAMAVGCGVLYTIFVAITHLSMAYILALMGIAISKVLKKVAGTGNSKVAILTVVFYVLAIIFSYVFETAFFCGLNLGGTSIFGYLLMPSVWKMALQILSQSGVFSGIIFFIGGIYAYQNALYE